MDSKLKLELGTVYYHRDEPLTGYEVIAKKGNYWYLAHLNGSVSNITYIPHSHENSFGENWFLTTKDAVVAHAEDLKLKYERFEIFTKEIINADI